MREFPRKQLFVNDVNIGKFEEAIFCEFWRFPGATEKIKMVNFESLPGVTSPGWAGLSPCSSRHSLCLAINSNWVKNLPKICWKTWAGWTFQLDSLTYPKNHLVTWAGWTLQSRVVQASPSWAARATTGGICTPPSEASELWISVFL